MIKITSALFFLLLISSSAMAQDVKTVRDIGTWVNVGIKYNINKDWRLNFNQDVRFFDNSSKLGKVTSEFSGQYKINKQFKIGAGLRYAYDRKKDNRFTHDIRYNIDLKYRLPIGESFQLEYRFRYQNNFIDLFTYYDEHTQRANSRNRVEAQYSLGNHDIIFSTELFRRYDLYRKPHFNFVRFTLGDQIKSKLGNMEYSINYQRELNVKYPLNFFFVSLGYTFNLKHA